MPDQTVARSAATYWDRVVTIVLIVVTVLGLAATGVIDLFMAAFTDYCPAPCQVDAGVSTVLTYWIVAAALSLAGTAFAIVRLTRHLRSWWVQLTTLLAVLFLAIIAIGSYESIIGY
jgi:hypothetical protein